MLLRPFLAALFCCCCVLLSPVEAQGLANVTIIPPPAALNITGLLPFNVTLNDKTLTSLPGLKYVVQKAVDEINSMRVILPNTTLNVTFYNTNATTTTSLAAVFAAQLDRSVGIIGPIYQDECLNSAMGSTVLTIPNIGPTTLVTSLTNRALYAYFTRMAPLPQLQSTVILDILDYFYRKSGQKQWREVTILSLTEETAILVASNMFFSAPNYNININTFQQFLSVLNNPNFERNIDTPLQKIVDSKSRIVVALLDTFNMQEVLKISSKDPYNLVGKQRIWICWSSCSGRGVYLDYSNINKPKVDKELLRLSSGLIAVSLPLGKGEKFIKLRQDYHNETGLELESSAATTFDAVYTLAYAIAATIKNGSLVVNGINVNPFLRFPDFMGLTGHVFFNKTTGERYPYFDIVNYKATNLDCPRCYGYADNDYSRRVGSWIVNKSLEIGRSEVKNDPGIFPITFYDGTTNIPDLDVRDPFDYWDCRDNEQKTDKTGKEINRETPDGDNPHYIDDKYICDQYIDCNNMMDEGYDCTPSYVIGFIVIGIIAGLFILADIFIYIPFIVLFSLMGFRRISYSLETFQLEIAIFSIFGYGSIYSFFGQDHPVSCAFRPWLLGFGICGVIAAHVARLLRIWRATRSPIKIKIGPSIEHLFYSIVFFLPAVFLLFLWTLISTPTADVDTIDGDKHYVCVTGGFTGPPGGIVFFFILVGYEIILLLFGLFITFLIRKVPVRYSEKRVHTLSLFNLLFLCCVIITVVFILKAANQPFAAWIVLMLAILYGFTSTIMLHFVPKVVGIVYFDKLKRDVANKEISDMSSSMTATATQQH